MILKCDYGNCNAPVAHAEHFYERIRGWCEAHTPWSGHYECCWDLPDGSPDPNSECAKLMHGRRMVQVKRTDELELEVPFTSPPPKLIWFKLPSHDDCDCMSCRPP